MTGAATAMTRIAAAMQPQKAEKGARRKNMPSPRSADRGRDAVVGNAVPHWWLGLMILVISANTIRLFPLGGMYTSGNDTLPDRLWHLLLPATMGAMSGWIVFSRFLQPRRVAAD